MSIGGVGAFGSAMQFEEAIKSRKKRDGAAYAADFTDAEELSFAELVGKTRNRFEEFEKIEENKMTDGQKDDLSLADLIEQLEGQQNLTAQELRKKEDWRTMSAEDWDGLMKDVDDYIEAWRERLKEMKEVQEEAAQKAASQAAPDQKTLAASTAALHAAASGFAGEAPTDDNDGDNPDAEQVPAQEMHGKPGHSKNWTRNLETDDQSILREAKAAQKSEKMALSKMQEIRLTESRIIGDSRAESAAESVLKKKDKEEEFNQFKVL
ncbi:MAG: hypothetical protein E7300_01205 [Lachnospiraceae bacterium]|nr:hypothetical protein [Lachnospiraceae bacterium]